MKNNMTDLTENTPKGIHAGHRQRLKAKVQSKGLDSLADHEVLELLLAYCIPYKNTNDMAHILIQKYGSLKNVFGHPESEYCKISGIQSHTAFFLSHFPAIAHRYAGSVSNDRPRLANEIESVLYFRSHHFVEPNESLLVCCLDAGNQLISAIETNSSSPTRVVIDMRYISSQILPLKPAAVVLFHTHPAGKAKPSQSDIYATKKLITLFGMLGIDLLDHIIMTEDSYFSFCNRKLISKYASQAFNIVETFAKSSVEEVKQDVSYDCQEGDEFDEADALPD